MYFLFSIGLYNGQNGRGPLPIPGTNNQNMYGQQPPLGQQSSYGQNNNNLPGQTLNNQYSTGCYHITLY